MNLLCRLGKHKWEYTVSDSRLMSTEKLHINGINRYCSQCQVFESIGYDVWLAEKGKRKWVSEKEADKKPGIFYDLYDLWISGKLTGDKTT